MELAHQRPMHSNRVFVWALVPWPECFLICALKALFVDLNAPFSPSLGWSFNCGSQQYLHSGYILPKGPYLTHDISETQNALMGINKTWLNIISPPKCWNLAQLAPVPSVQWCVLCCKAVLAQLRNLVPVQNKIIIIIIMLERLYSFSLQKWFPGSGWRPHVLHILQFL